VLAAWLAGPAVVMVTVSPAVLTVSRTVSWGHGAQISLAATVAQARGSNRGRQSPGGAAERCLDLAQAGRPVPVVFRRHPASVPW
jgi:hypothetical protein